MIPAASAANNQLIPEQVPSLEERTEAMTACLGAVLPQGIITLIAKQAMERFDDEIFGRQQWIGCWGATPVIFTKTLPELRELVNLKVISGAKTEKLIEQMNEVECANFLQGIEVCRDENFEPTDELYECLNRRVRPDDKVVAGFTCVVTYIPQFVRKDGRILAVTARTLASDIGPNPTEEGRDATLSIHDYAFNDILTPEDANRMEPSCYFMMEKDVAPNTKGKRPSVLIAEISQQKDKGWQLPETRNFFATIFSRKAWNRRLQYGQKPPPHTYGHGTYTLGQGKSRNGGFLVFGCSSGDGFTYTPDCGLALADGYEREDRTVGAGGSRKFLPKEK